MPVTIFDNFKRLYEAELYTSAIQLGQILLQSHSRNRLLTYVEYYQCVYYLALAHYQEQDYAQAERLLRLALSAHNMLEDNKELPVGNNAGIFDEFELKYKTAQCLAKLKSPKEAIQIIETIPTHRRTAKMHYLYGRLTRDTNPASSASAYKEVLKEHQLALDVAETLIDMLVNCLEMHSLCVDATHWPQCRWLSKWIEAHTNLKAGKFKSAAELFKQINAESPFQNHHRIMVQIGKAYFYDGSYDQALNYLERAHLDSPFACDEGIVLLANLLCRENRLADVEKLTSPVSVHDFRPEHWFIVALRLYFSDRHENVEYILEKARGKSTFLDIEVALLKAQVNIANQKFEHAMNELRCIQRVAPHRFELHKSLVDVETKRGNFDIAQMYAMKSMGALGETPRTMMLLVKVYERDPAKRAKLKPLLQQILLMDENYLPAIYMYVEVLLKEKEYAMALRLLKQQVGVQPNARIATKLGDICASLRDHLAAIDYYNMAVRLDPTCQKAINALNNLTVEGKRGGGGSGGDGGDCSGGMGTGTSMDKEMSTGSAGGDVPFDESGSLVQNDSLWSDVDGEMNNN